MAPSLSPQSLRVFRNTFTALLSGSLDQTTLLGTDIVLFHSSAIKLKTTFVRQRTMTPSSSLHFPHSALSRKPFLIIKIEQVETLDYRKFAASQ